VTGGRCIFEATVFMKPVLLCLAGALPLAFTVGCGQKGPLYLPPKNGTVVTRPAGSAGAPPQTTNQSSSQQDTTASPSTTTSESTPSGTLQQNTGPATQGVKQPPDKNDSESSTSQPPKRF
jgi:predicted small lipoprotein YifL